MDGMLDYTIREATVDDYDIVLDCVRDVYGEDYPQTEIYDKDYFRKALNKGELVFFVAVTADNDAAGIIGVSSKPFFNRLDYLVTQAVKHNYRRKGVGGRLMRQAISYLLERGYNAVYGNCVTTHTASQNEMVKLGFKCAGFLPGIRAGGDTPAEGKRTLCLLVLNAGKKDSGIIYVPQELQKTAERIYESVGSDCQIVTEEVPLSGQSEAEVYYDKSHGTIYIHITRAGADIGQLVQSAEAEYGESPICTSFVYMNIKNAPAVAGYRELSRLGYTFSGFKPVYYDYEYMLLYKGINISVEFSAVRLIDGYSEVFKEVLGAYARQID